MYSKEGQKEADDRLRGRVIVFENKSQFLPEIWNSVKGYLLLFIKLLDKTTDANPWMTEFSWIISHTWGKYLEFSNKLFLLWQQLYFFSFLTQWSSQNEQYKLWFPDCYTRHVYYIIYSFGYLTPSGSKSMSSPQKHPKDQSLLIPNVCFPLLT